MTTIDHARRLELIAAPQEPRRTIDRDAAERATADLLAALGADLQHDGQREPPRRVVEAYTFAGVIEVFARDLQVEGAFDDPDRRLAEGAARAQGVGVVLEAEHLCMSLRGVQKFGAKTVTSALDGLVRNDPRPRQEFLALTTRSDS